MYKKSFISKLFKNLIASPIPQELNFNKLTGDATKKYETWTDSDNNTYETLDPSKYKGIYKARDYLRDFKKIYKADKAYKANVGNKVYRNPLKEQFYSSYGLTLDNPDNLKSILKGIDNYRANLLRKGNINTNTDYDYKINPKIYKDSEKLYNFVVPIAHTGKDGLAKRKNIHNFFQLPTLGSIGYKTKPDNTRSFAFTKTPLSFATTSASVEEFTEHPFDSFISNNSKFLRNYLNKTYKKNPNRFKSLENYVSDRDKSFFVDVSSANQAALLDSYTRDLAEASVALSPLVRHFRKQNNNPKTIGKNITNLLTTKDEMTYIKELDKILNNIYPQKFYNSRATDSIKYQLILLRDYFNRLKHEKDPRYKKYLKELEKVTPGLAINNLTTNPLKHS